MSIKNLTIDALKTHYTELFTEYKANESPEQFKTFLLNVIKELSWGLDIDVQDANDILADPALCKTRQFGALDSLKRVLLSIAEGVNYKAANHPDWSLLAGRLEIQRLKLQVPETLDEMLNANPGIWRSDSDYDYYDFVNRHTTQLEQMIDPARDYDLYFFGVRTLEKSYLLQLLNGNSQLLETPQRLYLRVATLLWMPNLDAIKEYYDYMSTGLFTHASPTMFHAGVNKGSLASCFLLSMQDDLEKIFKCLGQCAMISKSAGGIGLDITNIRHSKVGHLGQSSGIVPMLKVYDAGMRYVDQAGRRKGSATIFTQPWTIDFGDFIELKRQTGKEELRARDLFYAVWSCDIFMERVINDQDWTMFCPKYAPKLTETYGEEFDKWYRHYETELLKLPGHENFTKVVKAQDIWKELIKTQEETGMPFMTHKDTANYTSNQKNLGLIRSSNLCTEIMEVTDETTISSCNLASLALDEYVVDGVYNFEKLGAITRRVIRGLNRVIDRTWYPLQERDNDNNVTGSGPIKTTNLKYRPLGLGVQALADAFLKMGLSWKDTKARELNRDIFATIYYYAMDESVEIAKEDGVYDGFYGSPASEGLLKPDLLAAERARKKLYRKQIYSDHEDYSKLHSELTAEFLAKDLSPLYDWDALRNKVKNYGLRNSLLIALMPTASSAQIRYKTEAFEPFTTNMYVRNVLSGNHVVVNRYMVELLKELDLWNRSVVNFIMKNEGSIQNLPENVLPEDLRPQLKRVKEQCLTAFELPQKLIVDMAVERSYYVCQSQSLNIFMKDPEAKLSKLHKYAWENGLSTGMYYLRTAPATEAVKFTTDGDLDVKRSVVCTDDICVSCTS